MSNLYGVANPVLLPVVLTTGGDVALPAGTETTVLSTSALIAPSQGFFYPLVMCHLAVLMGATAPTNLVLAFKLGAGSDVDTQAVSPATLNNGATSFYHYDLLGVASQTAWQSPGTVINITFNPTAQAATFKAVGSRVLVALFRAPDQ